MTMRLVLLAILIYSFSSWAQSEENFYQDLLERHAKQGHMTEKEALNHRIELEKTKRENEGLAKAVRGVASKIKTRDERKVLKLTNPVIEISAE